MRAICLSPVSPSSTPHLEAIKTDASIPGTDGPQHEGIITEPQIEEFITEDGILCSTLSSLTLIEAVRTSVLSPRWRPLWTRLTRFSFDAVNVLDAQTLRGRPLSGIEAYNETLGMTDKFIRAVNSVLQQLKSARLDRFAIRYFLDKTHSHHLDEWIRFAVASKPRQIRLHLFKSYSNPQVEPYDVKCQLLGSLSSLQVLSIIFCSFKLPPKYDGFRNLKKLSLANVHATEADFNSILSNCSSTLNTLCVWETPHWTSISVPHTLNRLRFLLVRTCDQLTKIEINAPNLVKLHYDGVPVDFKFRQSSKLNEARICFSTQWTMNSLDFYLSKISDALPHLQTLNLTISGASKVTDLPKVSGRLIYLTRLDCEWDASVEMSLLHLNTLLDVAPFLKELKLLLLTHDEAPPPQTPSKVREILPKLPYPHLKTIEVSGFCFNSWQTEIVAYLLTIATKLESLTMKKASEASHLVSEEIQLTVIKYLKEEIPANVTLALL